MLKTLLTQQSFQEIRATGRNVALTHSEMLSHKVVQHSNNTGRKQKTLRCAQRQPLPQYLLQPHPSSGAALIVVLILSAIIYLALNAVLLMTTTEIHLSNFEQRSIQAFYLAESALARGVAGLRAAPDDLTSFSDVIPGTLNVFSVSFSPKRYDEHESWYHLSLNGEGIVSGPGASATRRVSQEILIKPFALFAAQKIAVQDHCRIHGHLHGNQEVHIGADVTVEGHISSSFSEPIVSEDADLSEDEEPAREPETGFPAISPDLYFPQYLYQEKQYTAQALELTASLALSGSAERLLNVYRGQADPENNPAGIFVLHSAIEDDTQSTLTAIDLQGGSLVLPGTKKCYIKGLVHISPVENYPAVIHFGTGAMHLNTINVASLTFSDTGNTEISKLPTQNSIEGLLYSLGNLVLTAESGSVTLKGSIWAQNISVRGEATCKIDFSPGLMTNPPPGLKVVEYGAWRELLE
ncbi:hypothetical protein CSB45_11780 [candidate division KSB3 bacterium]|uniref:Type 4 fimbrial biogenesis protein PilX N-terminal domain-containing protein n=1 Tax=candidate division KSB3 bacterium TaxID=2044937 RepID=A0A2G6E2Q0_9BACT|nr:MAG: hypothetical protein CSB45_11780 [candidate division KSB3 bacterium]PIE29265.1 MAG: hypothetical protein CSA57_09670 [candidate division KSB3 bacterium]